MLIGMDHLYACGACAMRYFKRWAKIMGNFKNIAKTLAMHHQRNLCYELVGGTSYLHSATTTGPGKLKKIVHQTNLILL